MSKSNPGEAPADRDLYSGLIRLHVLHHAVEGPVFGLGLIEELARHGYRIRPGSLHPLHILQPSGKRNPVRVIRAASVFEPLRKSVVEAFPRTMPAK